MGEGVRTLLIRCTLTCPFFLGMGCYSMLSSIDKVREKIFIYHIHCFYFITRFHTITTAYYRGAMAIILVYDITSETSFRNITKWMRRIEENATEDVERLIIGNKCDLESKREVSRESAELFARRHNVKVIECSAMESINIDKAFETLTQDILNKVCPPQEREEPTPKGKRKKNKNVKLNKQNNNKSGGGCC